MASSWVSVPCRGILFFNGIHTLRSQAFWFPSPVGESYFSMIFLPRVQWQWLPVSAPCRGILFFNYMLFASESDYIVSVPCRGILFFNMSLHTSIARGHGEFPSPIGESYFSISLMRIKILCEQFPSPIGESYLSIIAVLTTKQKRKMPVSVPYRGILFFNKPQKITGNRKTVSVPYRGILFFN